MASVTFPEALGGNGQTYTDDADPNTGLDGLGYTIRFIPCLQQAVVMGLSAKNDAQAAASFVQQCQTLRQETATDRQAVAEDRAAVEQHLQDAQARIGTTQALIDARDTALAAQAGAEDAETGAVAAQTSAEAARDAAVVSGQVYPDTSAGLTATSDGQYFKTVAANQAGFLTLWRNNAGVATEIETYPSLTGIAQALEQANRKQTRLARSLQRLGDHGQTLHSDFDLDAHGLGTALVGGVQDALDSGELWTTVRETPTLAYQHTADGALKYVEVPPNVLAREWNPETGRYQLQSPLGATNLFRWSNKPNESGWVSTKAVLTNTTRSMFEGDLNGYELTCTESGSFNGRLARGGFPAELGWHTLSYIVEKASTADAMLTLEVSNIENPGGARAYFDLEKGQVRAVVSAGAGGFERKANIQSLDNGAYRLMLSLKVDVSGGTWNGFLMTSDEDTTQAQATVGNSIYVYHGQLIEGDRYGPVIVTEDAPVTRAPDHFSLQLEKGFNQSEGTWILDYTPLSAGAVRFGTSDGTFDNVLYIADNLISFRQRGVQIIQANNSEAFGERRIIGIALCSGNSATSINGNVVPRAGEFDSLNHSILRLAQAPWGELSDNTADIIVHDFIYVPKRMSDAKLQELTSL